MMDYKEMSAIIKERVHEVNYNKMLRARRIKQISFSMSGLCAAAIVGFGVWHNKDVKNAVHYENDSNIIEYTTTSTTDTEKSVNANEVTTVTANTFTDTNTKKSAKIAETATVKATTSIVTSLEKISVTMANTKSADTSIISETKTTTKITENNTTVAVTTTVSSEYSGYRFISYKSRIILENENELQDDMYKAELPDTAILNGKTVSLRSAQNYNISRKLDLMQKLNIDFFGDEEYDYEGTYNGVIDENVIDRYYGLHIFNYVYQESSNTVYALGTTLYKVWLGADKTGFAVKFDGSDNYYLYSMSRIAPYEEIKTMSVSDPRFVSIYYGVNNLPEKLHDVWIGEQRYVLTEQTNELPEQEYAEHNALYIKAYCQRLDTFYAQPYEFYKIENDNGTYSYYFLIYEYDTQRSYYYFYEPVIDDGAEYILYNVSDERPCITIHEIVTAPDEETVHKLFETLQCGTTYQLIGKADADETKGMSQMHERIHSYHTDINKNFFCDVTLYNWSMNDYNDLIIKFDGSDEYYYYLPAKKINE